MPEARLNEFGQWHNYYNTRDQQLINRRFPNLEQARQGYFGVDKAKSPLKKLHTKDLVTLSQVVYDIA